LPILVVIRLNVPAQAGAASLIGVRLAWDDPRSGVRRSIRASLDGLRSVPLDHWIAQPIDPAVREQEALLMVARAQKEASRAHQRGDLSGTLEHLEEARALLLAMPPSPETEDELQAITDIETAAREGRDQHAQKLAKYRAYNRNQSRPSPRSPASPKRPGKDKSGR
jgi:hypothetical protein